MTSKKYIILLSLSMLTNAICASKFRVTNRASEGITVFALLPGRTYDGNNRPQGDHVSHTAPLAQKYLPHNGDYIDFETDGGTCIGAIVVSKGNVSWNADTIHFADLIDKGDSGWIDCYRTETKTDSEGKPYTENVLNFCPYIDSSSIHCALVGSRKKWKVIKKGGSYDLKDDK